MPTFRDVRDKPLSFCFTADVSPNSITPTAPKLPVQGSFGKVGVMEFGLVVTACRVLAFYGSVGLQFSSYYNVTLFQRNCDTDVT